MFLLFAGFPDDMYQKWKLIRSMADTTRRREGKKGRRRISAGVQCHPVQSYTRPNLPPSLSSLIHLIVYGIIDSVGFLVVSFVYCASKETGLVVWVL